MIDGLTLVEAGHFDRVFDRRTLSVDLKRSIIALRDRNDATVDLRCEWTIYPYLLVTGGFPLRERRVIEIRKSDGALDLQGAIAFKENRRRMRVDAMDMRMRCRIGQKCEDALLHPGVG